MSFLMPQIKDIIDILVIAFVIYQSLLIVRKSGAYQVLYGLIVILLVYLVAIIFGLRMISSVLSALRNYWILGLVILFQPEIRSILARINISREVSGAFKKREKHSFHGPLIDAISSMAFRKTGALIIIENKRKLNEFTTSSEYLDAAISMRLILSIFNTKSVLHDGAIVIRKDRIVMAKVVLPLSKNPEYMRQYGTRHLAGIGITEVSDALAIIVSEQSGTISVARGGKINSGLAFEEVVQIISDATKFA